MQKKHTRETHQPTRGRVTTAAASPSWQQPSSRPRKNLYPRTDHHLRQLPAASGGFRMKVDVRGPRPTSTRTLLNILREYSTGTVSAPGGFSPCALANSRDALHGPRPAIPILLHCECLDGLGRVCDCDEPPWPDLVSCLYNRAGEKTLSGFGSRNILVVSFNAVYNGILTSTRCSIDA